MNKIINKHQFTWLVSLMTIPVTILIAYKGGNPLHVVTWLSFVVAVQLLYLLPEALTEKEVYNDEF